MSGHSEITVTREKQFLSAWSRFKILVDDEQVGALIGGESLTTEVSLGEHRVAVQHREFTVYLDVDCPASSRHEFVTGFSVGLLSGLCGASAYASHEAPVYLQESEP